MNKENVLALAERMEGLEEYDDATNNRDNMYSQREWVFGCGSPACIAGHAAAMLGTGIVTNSNADRMAMEFLGIDWHEAHDLFDSMPNTYFENDPSPKDAACVLRHLAATGKVDWFEATKPKQE